MEQAPNDDLAGLQPPSASRAFLDSEAIGGLILMGVAAAALVVANSPLASIYFDALGAKVLGLSVLHWINDGLMAVFFLMVGLEIKREILDGQLSTWARRVLPGVGALGGMVVPAAIYVALNAGAPGTLGGWAIPAATDIAFALGVLALLGERVPASLRVFLAALAILDDLGAVAIIAVFYVDNLSLPMLAAAFACLVALALLNRTGIRVLWPYLTIGALLWFFVLRSGIHATLAGVALAFTIPLDAPPGPPEAGDSLLHRLEHALQPWVAFLIVPIFGFANAGVSFAGLSLDMLLAPLPLGVALGLFVGKQAGVYLTVWAAIRAGFAEMPAGATLAQCYGVSILCGIGFTMSLFIGSLAFPYRPDLIDASKLGILAGSALSALLGFLVLRLAPGRSRQARSAAIM